MHFGQAWEHLRQKEGSDDNPVHGIKLLYDFWMTFAHKGANVAIMSS